MTNYTKTILESLKLQGIETTIENVALNIYLINEFCLIYCFILKEDYDSLTVIEISFNDYEEIRIISKDKISHIEIVYEREEVEAEETIIKGYE